jgi:Tol biopolymer transport system component
MKRTLLCICLAFALLVPAAAQAAKKPFAIADLFRLKTVADPQISPDGAKIAFVVTESDLAKGKTNSDIYLMNADGTGLRRLTTSDKSDDHPRWAPDGKSLLFLSSRKDGPQVWRLPADLGEPEALTKLSTGASDAEWSPDGKSILFTSEVFPECGADDACNQKIQKGWTKAPCRPIWPTRCSTATGPTTATASASTPSAWTSPPAP